MNLHEVLDQHDARMRKAINRGIAREDWHRLTDLQQIGRYWDEIGFDLWLEQIIEAARNLRR